LSNSNASLAKKTLAEYLHNKENPGIFKARALDKKILEQPAPTYTPGKGQVTEALPFVFKTDERIK
jgi:hypothetical protein